MIGPFNLNRVHCGDALEMLKRLPDESVQVCVTSPPYWGLRDYGTAKWEGGDPACGHLENLGGQGEASAKQTTSAGTQKIQYREICGKCGARRIDNQLGLEPTPQEYIAKMAVLFEEVRRVLRMDGTLWLNIGDSYCGYKGENYQRSKQNSNLQWRNHVPASHDIGSPRTCDFKSKDLIGIPWRLAFALQAAGWYLRADIIWAKPNPMPESVKDRPTKSHEYLFLLAKSDRYYYDAEAIKENLSETSDWDYRQRLRADKVYDLKEPYKNNFPGCPKQRKLTKPAGWATGKDHSAIGWANEQNQGRGNSHGQDITSTTEQLANGRNKRSVWEIATVAYTGAHFATFPPALVEPCILAGSKPEDVVLDPFAGSGTTGMVALQHGRKFIGFDLNPKYCQELAAPRLAAAERGQTVEQYEAGQLTIFDALEAKNEAAGA
jgi:DNA modification methylase